MTPREPARNRVTPVGNIAALPGRGAWMGNRGVLHDASGTRDIVREFRSSAWITCALSFRGRRVTQWEPGRYTPLFFLDEAVAFAAGHRPCAECRRPAFNAYRAAWSGSGGDVPYAKEMDETLHRQRRPAGSVHSVDWPGLPDGVFVLVEHGGEANAAVVVGDHLAVWEPIGNGYAAHLPRPSSARAAVLTPPASLDVLRAGYPVQIDPAAR